MSVHPIPDGEIVQVQPEVLSDEQVTILNAARTVLMEIGDASSRAGWRAPVHVTFDEHGRLLPTSQDYGRIQALADVAEHGIFQLLNWANAHHVRRLTDRQIHNHD